MQHACFETVVKAFRESALCTPAGPGAFALLELRPWPSVEDFTQRADQCVVMGDPRFVRCVGELDIAATRRQVGELLRRPTRADVVCRVQERDGHLECGDSGEQICVLDEAAPVLDGVFR